jgi:hypothetical protein
VSKTFNDGTYPYDNSPPKISPISVALNNEHVREFFNLNSTNAQLDNCVVLTSKTRFEDLIQEMDDNLIVNDIGSFRAFAKWLAQQRHGSTSFNELKTLAEKFSTDPIKGYKDVDMILEKKWKQDNPSNGPIKASTLLPLVPEEISLIFHLSSSASTACVPGINLIPEVLFFDERDIWQNSTDVKTNLLNVSSYPIGVMNPFPIDRFMIAAESLKIDSYSKRPSSCQGFAFVRFSGMPFKSFDLFVCNSFSFSNNRAASFAKLNLPLDTQTKILDQVADLLKIPEDIRIPGTIANIDISEFDNVTSIIKDKSLSSMFDMRDHLIPVPIGPGVLMSSGILSRSET